MPKQSGQRKPESQVRFCAKEESEQEFRRYRRGKKANGDPIYQWRCVSCLSASDKRSKKKYRSDLRLFTGSGLIEDQVLNLPTSRVHDIIKLWNQWVDATGRPDRNKPNGRFTETCHMILDSGEMTMEEMSDVIDAASYFRPRARDPFDVRRVLSALTWEHQADKARSIRALGYSPRHMFDKDPVTDRAYGG